MICVLLFHMTGVGYERLRGGGGSPPFFRVLSRKSNRPTVFRGHFVFVLREGAGLHCGAISLAPTTEFSAQHFFSRDTSFVNI